MRIARVGVCVLVAAALLLMCACGGNSKSATPQVTSITISSQNSSVALGQTTQYSATVTFSDGSSKSTSVMWTSSNTAVATIDANGLATSKGQGTTTITAMLNNLTSTSTLTVGPAVLAWIKLSTTTPSVALGLGSQFTLTGTMTDGTAAPSSTLASCTFASTNTAVATVDSKGAATTKSTGSASISATCGTLTQSATLTVTPAVLASISLSPNTPTLALGLTTQFTATGTMTDGTPATVTFSWTSSNAGVATIDGSTGAVITKSQGNTTITATSGSITGSTTLTVGAPAMVSIAVTPPALHIKVGDTQQFTATATMTDGSTPDVTSTVTWQSSDDTKVEINYSGTAGLAYGVAAGADAVTITATKDTVTNTASLMVDAALVNYGGTLYAMAAKGAYSDGMIRTYDIQTDGTLVENGTSPLSVDISGGFTQQHIALHPNGKFLFVLYAPDSCNGEASGWVITYQKGAEGLQKVDDSDYQVPGCVTQFAISPDGKWMYVAGGSGFVDHTTHVTLYNVNPDSGYVVGTAKELVLNGMDTLRAMLFKTDSTHVYFAGSMWADTNSLLAATINADGSLTPDNEGSMYAPYMSTSAIALDHTGLRLYAADGLNNNSIISYCLDAAGALGTSHATVFGPALDLAFDPVLGYAYATVNDLVDGNVFANYKGIGDTSLALYHNIAPFGGDRMNSIRVHPSGGVVYVGTIGGKIGAVSVGDLGQLHSAGSVQYYNAVPEGSNGAWIDMVVVPPAAQVQTSEGAGSTTVFVPPVVTP